MYIKEEIHRYIATIIFIFSDFVLPNFPFTTSETMWDHYLWTWKMQVASQVAKWLET